MLVKLPPANTTPTFAARADTVPPTSKMSDVGPVAFGFQSVTAPFPAKSAAMWLRGCPPMLVKLPPTYTVPPLTAIAPPPAVVQTVAPLAASRAATLVSPQWQMGCPGLYTTAYTLPPLTTSSLTSAPTFGLHGVTAPLATSKAAT